MNKTLIICMGVALLAAPVVSQANNDATTLTGALLGAAGGLIVANHSDHISRAVAVPVGALIGGLIAHEAQNYRWDDYGYRWDDYGYRGYGWDHYRPGYRYRDDVWGYPRYDYYGRYYRPSPRVVVVRAAEPQRKARIEQPKPADLHPGVDLIKVSVPFSSGVSVDIPVLRTGGKFIGPQGEEYPSLPTTKQLAEKYAR